MDFAFCLLYKTSMSKAMLTHFGTVSLLHVAILFLGATAIQSELSKNNVPKFGNGGAIQLQLGSTFGKRAPAPVIARPVPKKVIANPVVSKFARPAPAPEVQKVVPTGSAQTTQGTSTVAGTGGNPNGHALGSGSTGTGKFDIVSLYKAELRAEIDKNKSYPAMSKRLGQTGTVLEAFTLHRTEISPMFASIDLRNLIALMLLLLRP